MPENDVTADQSNNSSSLAFYTDELKQLSLEAHNDKSVSQNITNLAKDSNSQIITQDNLSTDTTKINLAHFSILILKVLTFFKI